MKFWNRNVYSFFKKNYGTAHNSLRGNWQEIGDQLKNRAKNIVVMTGAGISTPSGIPDFRTPGSGIYDNLQKYRLPYPEAIFDIEYFKKNPKPFNTWAKEFFPGVNYKPNIAHFFIKLLHDEGHLVRLYTQNIDGLDLLTGLPEDKIVFAHGSFSSASCISCHASVPLEKVKQDILKDEIPKCEKCGSLIKPDIVFFGEMLPERFQMFHEDLLFSDYMICIGTSLEVYPFAGIADAAPGEVPRLLINRDLVGSFGSRPEDRFLGGELTENVKKLAKYMELDQKLDLLVKNCVSENRKKA